MRFAQFLLHDFSGGIARQLVGDVDGLGDFFSPCACSLRLAARCPFECPATVILLVCVVLELMPPQGPQNLGGTAALPLYSERPLSIRAARINSVIVGSRLGASC